MRVDARTTHPVTSPTCPPCVSSLTHVDGTPGVQPQEAGARWRKRFGDKVPTEEELAERDRAQSTDTKSSWFW